MSRALWDALDRQDLEYLRTYLTRPDTLWDLDANVGGTILRYCIEIGFTAGVNLLLQAGASVNNKNIYGETALHLSARTPHNVLLPIVRALINAGGDPSSKSNSGVTPLRIAKNRQELTQDPTLEEAITILRVAKRTRPLLNLCVDFVAKRIVCFSSQHLQLLPTDILERLWTWFIRKEHDHSIPLRLARVLRPK